MIEVVPHGTDNVAAAEIEKVGFGGLPRFDDHILRNKCRGGPTTLNDFRDPVGIGNEAIDGVVAVDICDREWL